MRSRRSKSATSSGLAKCKSLHTLISSPNVATSRCLEFTKTSSSPTPIGHWLPLPSEYRYARRASRDELRDFFYLLGCDDTLAQATR